MEIGNKPIGEQWGRKPLASGDLWVVYRIEPQKDSRGREIGETLISHPSLLSGQASRAFVEVLNQKG